MHLTNKMSVTQALISLLKTEKIRITYTSVNAVLCVFAELTAKALRSPDSSAREPNGDCKSPSLLLSLRDPATLKLFLHQASGINHVGRHI